VDFDRVSVPPVQGSTTVCNGGQTNCRCIGNLPKLNVRKGTGECDVCDPTLGSPRMGDHNNDVGGGPDEGYSESL
jgi:hypothetical protein